MIAEPELCPKCDQPMRSDMVKTAIWAGARLFIVQDIPAQVCDSCVEQFYDEETTDALRRLTEEGFPPAEAKREILVPVFSLAPRLPKVVASREPDAD
jgi:YgiT-type zinc finger domain-containing protein